MKNGFHYLLIRPKLISRLFNSDHKVPVSKDAEVIIWDSLAIIDYLSEKYLNGTGWPTEPVARDPESTTTLSFRRKPESRV